mmetsp:Transcript_69844/g.160576  ORF Transcript_69844/g.160576 Transcript_69844/m.160576 type:complete len:302 (-) Transcript_69844:312-1217(-)
MKVRKTVSSNFACLRAEVERGTSQSLTLEMMAQMVNAAPSLLRVQADPESTVHKHMFLVVQVDAAGKALTHTTLAEAVREKRCDEFDELLEKAWPVAKTHSVIFPPLRPLQTGDSDPDRLLSRMLPDETPVKKRRVEGAEKSEPTAVVEPQQQPGAAPKSVFDQVRERVRARQAAKAAAHQFALPFRQADDKKTQIQVLNAMAAFASGTLNLPLCRAKTPLQTTVRTMCRFLQERAQLGLTLEQLEKHMRELTKVVDAKGRAWVEIVPPRSAEVTSDLIRLSNVADFRDVEIALEREAGAA